MLNQKESNVKIIVANWQMNGDFDFTYHYFKHLCECALPENLRIIICPPLPFINLGFRLLVEHEITQICLGAQDVSSTINTNTTGGISATMLKECGATAVLIENVSIHNASNSYMRVKNTIQENLCPILCINVDISQQANTINDSISKQINDYLQDLNTLEVIMVAFTIKNVEHIDNTLLMQHIYNIASIIRTYITTNYHINSLFVLYNGNINGSNINTIIANNNVDGVVLTDYSLQTHNFCETLEHLQLSN